MNSYFLIWTADDTYLEEYNLIIQVKNRLDDLKVQYPNLTYKIVYGYEIFNHKRIS